MKKYVFTLCFITFTLHNLSCTDSVDKDKSQSKFTSNAIPEKKLCEIITLEMMSEITGNAFNEVIVTINDIDKSSQKYVSQCAYYSNGINISILVRRFGNTEFSIEKEKLIGEPKTGDKEMDQMLHDAIQTSKIVNDLGDTSVFFNLAGSYNLISVFNRYYQIQISGYGKKLSFDDITLQLFQKVTVEVMKFFR